jgi:hypothetical protein
MSRSSALPQLSAGPRPVIKTTENDTKPSIKRVETDTEYGASDLDPGFWQSAVNVAAEYDDPPEHLIRGKFLFVMTNNAKEKFLHHSSS